MSLFRKILCGLALASAIPAVGATPAVAADRPVSLAPADLGGRNRDCTGQPDQTAALQRWIDRVPQGSIARLQPDRCYKVEGTLSIHDKVNVILEGNGSMIRAYTGGRTADGECQPNRAHVSIANSVFIEVRGLHVEGPNPSAGPDGSGTHDCYYAQHAFRIDGDSEGANNAVRLRQVTANRVYGDFVYVRDSDNVFVEESIFGVPNFPYDVNPTVPDADEAPSGTGRQAIAITGGDKVTIRGNWIFGARRSAIDIEPNGTSDVVSNVSITDNQIRDYRLNAFTAGGKGTVTDVTVRNNVLNHFRMSIVPGRGPSDPTDADAYTRRNFVIADNRATVPHGGTRAITLQWVDGVRIENNRAPLRLYSDGPHVRIVDAYLSRDIRVTDNTFTPGTHTGSYRNTVSVCERNNVVTVGQVAPISPGATACPTD